MYGYEWWAQGRVGVVRSKGYVPQAKRRERGRGLKGRYSMYKEVQWGWAVPRVLVTGGEEER